MKKVKAVKGYENQPYPFNLIGITEEEYNLNCLHIFLQPFFSAKHLPNSEERIQALVLGTRGIIQELKNRGAWYYTVSKTKF